MGEVAKDWKPLVFDERDQTRWGFMIQNRKLFVCGERVDIGAFTYINARYGVTLDDDVQIGSHCSIYSHNTEDDTQGLVWIKKGAHIGAHSVIMPGVRIGVGATIGACSLVKSDVPDGETWVGVPAKRLRRRGEPCVNWSGRVNWGGGLVCATCGEPEAVHRFPAQ